MDRAGSYSAGPEGPGGQDEEQQVTHENSVVDTAESGSTGDSRVDGILTLLGELEEKPVEEHAEVFLELHTRLQGELNPGTAARKAGPHDPA